VRDTAAVLAKLNHLHVDIVFDFEFFSKFSTLISALSRAPVRAGFSLPARWREKIVTHPVLLDKAVHVSETFCNQVYSLGAPHRVPELAVPRIHEDDVRKLKKKIPTSNEPFVTINVNAGPTFLERRWAPSRFAKLVDTLAEQERSSFIFTGTEGERDYVEAVIQLSKYKERCFNAAGMLNLGQLLALLKQSDMLISNDSGPLHLAASLGTPTIGLFGPETPRFYGQQNHRSHSIYKSIPCSPCMNIYNAKTFRCPYNAQCMEAITVHEVRSAVETLHEFA